ncbi:hypothetical protein FOCC_FOCC010909 [Frankliniella occidentalis]|nr:hypothetical protein FOCC_FOCC010909 [Frankliniella occidentalis]
MPRQAAIAHEDLKKLITSETDVTNEEGKVAGPSHDVWLRLADKTNGTYTNNYMYVYVKQNRYDILTTILESKGIKYKDDSASEDEDVDGEGSERESDDQRSDVKKELEPMTTFRVLISPEDWLSMKPIVQVTERNDRPTKTRERLVLPQFLWEPMLIKCLWNQHKLPCPYTFIRGNVSTSATRDCYIRVLATCKECESTATGIILSEPTENEVVAMSWTANDTRGLPHQKKRPLSHYVREDVGGELQGKSTAQLRKEHAEKSMQQGDLEPPFLFRQPSMRKAKQDISDRLLQLQPNASSDPVFNLQQMKCTEPYGGSIHQIGVDPFFVHYHSKAQMHVFKKFAEKSYIVMALDATGSLVKKLRLPSGRSSPHIFLYEGVILAGEEQLPVCQMLSARQDANIIKFWIDELLRDGAPIPKEVVTDHSKALINAVVVTFCGCYSLRDYFERCFHVLSTDNDEEVESCLPSSFLRLDIAHLIGGASKWKVWQSKSTNRLKTFYMHCLGILALETKLEDFSATFVMVGQVANCLYTDSQLQSSVGILTTRIEGLPQEMSDLINEEDDATENCDDPATTSSDSLLKYINDIQKKIADESARLNSGQNPNIYYSPDVWTKFLGLLPDFLLWTAVMVDKFQSPTLTGSSARVESDFSIIKQGILSGQRTLYRLDKFVAKHLKTLEGSCRLSEAKDKTSSHLSRKKNNSKGASGDADTTRKKKKIPPTYTSKEKVSEETDGETSDKSDTEHQKSLNEIENWKGRGSPPPKKSKTSKYLNSNPELSLVMSSNSLNPPKERVLLNGFKKGFMTTADGRQVELTNTCSFDVLVQIITSGYIQYDFYRKKIDALLDSNHLLLETCKSLALNGAVHATYLLRIQVLSNIFPPVKQAVPRRTTRSKQVIPSIKYDCFSDLVDTARKLLLDVYSTTLVYTKCSQRTASRPCTLDDSETVINADVEVLAEGGLKDLGKAILVSSKMMAPSDEQLPPCPLREGIQCAPPCTGITTVKCKFGPHIIVNVDVFASSSGVPVKSNVKIGDVPTELQLVGTKFILCGIASRQNGHYVAYGRRVTGQWETYNDLYRLVKGAKITQQIEPVFVMYVNASM